MRKFDSVGRGHDRLLERACGSDRRLARSFSGGVSLGASSYPVSAGHGCVPPRDGFSLIQGDPPVAADESCLLDASEAHAPITLVVATRRERTAKKVKLTPRRKRK